MHILHVPTLKPLDVEAIVAAAEKTGLVVTAEEHTDHRRPRRRRGRDAGRAPPHADEARRHRRRLQRVGAATTRCIEKYGLTSHHIADAARDACSRGGVPASQPPSKEEVAWRSCPRIAPTSGSRTRRSGACSRSSGRPTRSRSTPSSRSTASPPPASGPSRAATCRRRSARGSRSSGARTTSC